jgi:hypothetical protein
VKYQDDSDLDYQATEQTERNRRRLPQVITLAALMIVGVGSAFAWREFAGTAYPTLGFDSHSIDRSSVDRVRQNDENKAIQQRFAAQLQSNAQLLAAQQAELKQLTAQMAALATKIDAILSSALSARAPMPATAGTPPAPKPRKPNKPKSPAASISTGGAPLPPPALSSQ